MLRWTCTSIYMYKEKATACSVHFHTLEVVRNHNQSRLTPSLHLWFLGVAEDCCMLSILLAVPSCLNSFWHGVIPTSYFIFNDFLTVAVSSYTCTRSLHRIHVQLPLVSLWIMGMKCFSMSSGEWASATALSDSTALSRTTVSSTVARLSSGGCGRVHIHDKVQHNSMRAEEDFFQRKISCFRWDTYTCTVLSRSSCL